VKRALIALCLACAPVSPLLAQNVLNLRDADIRAFIQDASRVTGRTFIIDPSVQGRVSVVTERPLSQSEYFELFLSTMRANGFVAVPVAGGALRIQPIAGAASTAPVGRRARAGSFVTEIFRLRHIDPAAAVETLRPMISRDGSITASRSSILVSDFADNIARVRQVLARIDVDSQATRIVGLDNSGAREIAAALSQLAPEGVTVVPIDSSNAIALRGDGPAVASLISMAQELDRRAAHGSEIRVVFLEHADAEQLLPVLQQVIGEAPTSTSSASGPGSRLSSLNNSSSASNGSSPTGTTGMGRPAPAAPTPVSTNAPGATGGGTATGGRNAVVTRFEGANAIVISAAPDIQRTLGEVIRQLDVRRPQVLVEAIIVEISDTAAQQLGVQLFLSGLRGSNIPFGITNYSNISPNIGTIAGAVAARQLGGTTTTVTTGTGSTTTTTTGTGSDLINTAASQLSGINGGLAGIALHSGSAIFGAILNAVRSDNQSNILSTPSIMTLDNVEGHILVGQEIPITTGQALSPNFDNTFRTVQRQNVGITLQVRPQINAGGTIKLDLRVEVSSIAGPVAAGSQDLILNKREIENTITIDEGDIVGVGGLLDDNDRRTLDRVPLLGDIPILGNLFRSRGRSRARTNLMVFIRPTILRTAEDAQEMTARRYNYVRGHQLIVNPNREPTLDELVRDYLGTTPPAAAPGPQPQDQVVTPVPLPPSAAAPQ
jgi:general secretion pathway protein D